MNGEMTAKEIREVCKRLGVRKVSASYGSAWKGWPCWRVTIQTGGRKVECEGVDVLSGLVACLRSVEAAQ